MNLKKYLEENGIKIGSFAKRIGVSRQTLDRILNGHEVVLSTALKIEDITEGKVTCRDLQPRMLPKPDSDNAKKNKPQNKA